jgi:ABC-type transport system involved in cytochrome c biogenesis permease component
LLSDALADFMRFMIWVISLQSLGVPTQLQSISKLAASIACISVSIKREYSAQSANGNLKNALPPPLLPETEHGCPVL